MIIAIDGPSGSGKSTTARLLAQHLNITHLDTGAMYRVITWGLKKENIDINDISSVNSFLEKTYSRTKKGFIYPLIWIPGPLGL